MSKFYAVKKGRKTGIFNSWDECKNSVSDFSGAIYKSFSTLEDAKNFLEDKESVITDAPTAYIDGSYNPSNEEYSFGAVLLINGKEYTFSKRYEKDEYSVHRNVAGELKGAGFIIQHAINNGIKELNVYYDYEGIRAWYLGTWKANKPLTQTYSEFAQRAKKKIKVNFVKVKSHSNDKYNDMVDLLAKKALNID